MRVSIMAGRVYSVIRAVGEALRGADGFAKRDAACDRDGAKLNLQTLEQTCSLSLNTLGTPVDAGVFTSYYAIFAMRILQKLAQFVGRKQSELRHSHISIWCNARLLLRPTALIPICLWCSAYSFGAEARQIVVQAKSMYGVSLFVKPGMPSVAAFADTPQELEPLSVASLEAVMPGRFFRDQFTEESNSLRINGLKWWRNTFLDKDGYTAGAPMNTHFFCPHNEGFYPEYPVLRQISAENYVYECFKNVPDIECTDCPTIGNPVTATTGWKLQIENDYSSASINLNRRYRSNVGTFSSVITSQLIDYSFSSGKPSSCYLAPGATARDNNGAEINFRPYCFSYSGNGIAEYQFIKSDGYTTVFTGPPTAPTKPANINESAVQLTDANGIKTWKITREDDSKEIYSAGGLLQSKTTRAGQLTTFTYSDATTPISIAPRPNLMLSQTDPFGHTLQ